jgi:glycerol-3-phosphate O-acyltransferase
MEPSAPGVAAAAIPVAPATAPAADTAAATTVPRGESLTPEQIAAHVAKLKQMIAQQQQSPQAETPEQSTDTPERAIGVAIPVRDANQSSPQAQGV